jgi:hypothetical protein
MKTKLLLAIGVLAIAMAATTAVQADEISFEGTATASVSADGTTTTFSPDSPWEVISGSGSYSDTVGQEADFYPIAYTGSGTSAMLTDEVDLWSFTLSDVAYSFELTALTDAVITGGTVAMSGTGTALIGTESMDATFSLEGDGSDDTFDIDFSTTQTGTGSGGGTVPDGGMTVAMLGLALGVCGMFARKLQRA